MGSTGVARNTFTGRTPAFQTQQQQAQSIPPVNQNNPNVANQAPTPQNTPVGTDATANFANMDDASRAALINAAKKAILPNQLADGKDLTQQVVFQAGINEKPMVLDRNAFDQFVKDNNLQNNILSRAVRSNSYTNALGRKVQLQVSDISDMLKYSRVNYIGGKFGGTAYGSGTYFAQTGGIGKGTGYSGTVLNAVLNPNTARIITENQLYRDAKTWAQSNPLSAKALGGSINSGNSSAYALAMGYNVVTSNYNQSYPSPSQVRSGDYVVVIDRKALVWLQ